MPILRNEIWMISHVWEFFLLLLKLSTLFKSRQWGGLSFRVFFLGGGRGGGGGEGWGGAGPL